MNKKNDDFDDWFYMPSEPIPVADGIKARNQSGAFTRNWWARLWLQALTQVMDASRLARGKQYARAGQVIALDIQLGLVLSQVQGSRPRPYRQRIELRVFDDGEWERILAALAKQALFTAQLLNGEMPQNIEEAFNSAELSLFPTSTSDLNMSCTCPDWVRPCKHLAAILLLLGETLDTDPFLLFVMRGRSRDQVMAALRERRATYTGGSEMGSNERELAQPTVPANGELTLEQQAERFWRMGQEIDSVQVHVAPPEVEMEVVKVLGDPGFAEDYALPAQLAKVYRSVSERAIQVAYAAHEQNDTSAEPTEPASDAQAQILHE
ncbi:MAG: SWIM zinc finger family protein [Anaerolineae bacterium]